MLKAYLKPEQAGKDKRQMNVSFIVLKGGEYSHYYTEDKSRKQLLRLALKEVESTGHSLDDVLGIFGATAHSYEEYRALMGRYAEMKLLKGSLADSLNG